MPLKPRILIVEDNADLRRLYAIGLNQRGFEVKLAANGAEAVDRVESDRPDLILLDLIMPVMDGWEVLQRVNPPERNDHIPIIVISGHSESPEVRPPCITAWLSKPVSIDELAQHITQQFARPA